MFSVIATRNLRLKLIFLTENINSATISSSKTQSKTIVERVLANEPHSVQTSKQNGVVKWSREMESTLVTYHWSIDSESTPLGCLRFRSSVITLIRRIFVRFLALVQQTGKYDIQTVSLNEWLTTTGLEVSH